MRNGVFEDEDEDEDGGFANRPGGVPKSMGGGCGDRAILILVRIKRLRNSVTWRKRGVFTRKEAKTGQKTGIEEIANARKLMRKKL